MGNDLAVPENVSLVAQNYTEEQIANVAAASEYFKRLQLMGSNSEAAKEGKIQMGHYAFVTDKETMKDLGDQIDVLVCGMRLKAMQILDGEVINIYNPADPEFSRIREASGEKDSGCLCGLDFLIWLPTEKEFVTFYMASKSAKREAPALRSHMNEAERKPGPATLTVKLAKNKKYSWHVTVVQDCTTEFVMPSIEQFISSLDKFQNPPKPESVAVAPETNERAR